MNHPLSIINIELMLLYHLFCCISSFVLFQTIFRERWFFSIKKLVEYIIVNP